MKTKLTNKQKILLLTKHDLNLISPPKKKTLHPTTGIPAFRKCYDQDSIFHED